jgi:hypothetical protein
MVYMPPSKILTFEEHIWALREVQAYHLIEDETDVSLDALAIAWSWEHSHGVSLGPTASVVRLIQIPTSSVLAIPHQESLCLLKLRL